MAKVWSDYVNGTDFGIFSGENLIAAATDNQMQLTTNMIVVSNKGSGKAVEYRPGRDDGTASGTSNLTYNEGFGFWDLVALKHNKTKVIIKYSNDETGDSFYEREAYINELSRQDPDDETSTMTYTFQFTGEGEVKEVPA